MAEDVKTFDVSLGFTRLFMKKEGNPSAGDYFMPLECAYNDVAAGDAYLIERVEEIGDCLTVVFTDDAGNERYWDLYIMRCDILTPTDLIEVKGNTYRLVNRPAKAGDYIGFYEDGYDVKKGRLYQVLQVRDDEGYLAFIDDVGDLHYWDNPSFDFFVAEKVDEDTSTLNEKLTDNVNHPSHYTTGGIETIDYIEAKLSHEQFTGYLAGNVLKYVSRFQHKNGLEDLKKARWYIDRLIKTYEAQNEDGTEGK